MKRKILILIILAMLVCVVTGDTRIDLRNNMPPVFNQGKTNSCTAQAFSAALAYQIRSEMDEDYEPSVMFLYHMAKISGGDIGISFQEAYNAISEYGVCPFEYYPWTNTYLEEPTEEALKIAKAYKAKSFAELDMFGPMQQVIDCLGNNHPVIINTDTTIWGSVGRDGICRKALQWKDTYYSKSGHAMLIVGYIPDFDIDGAKTPVFIVRNSYGSTFGDNGHAYVPAQKLWECNIAQAWAISIQDDLPNHLQHDFTNDIYFVQNLVLYSTYPDKECTKYTFYENGIGYHGILFYDESKDDGIPRQNAYCTYYKRYASGYTLKMHIGGWSDEAVEEKDRLENVSRRYWNMRENSY